MDYELSVNRVKCDTTVYQSIRVPETRNPRVPGQIGKIKRATLVRHFKTSLEPSKRAEKLSHMMFRKVLYFGCPTNSV